MNDVQGVLAFLEYREVRPAGEDWQPVADVAGRYGTTDRTKILSDKREPTARLVNRDTGRQVGTARRSCPYPPGEGPSGPDTASTAATGTESANAKGD
jgi:hypothetical protein